MNDYVDSMIYVVSCEHRMKRKVGIEIKKEWEVYTVHILLESVEISRVIDFFVYHLSSLQSYVFHFCSSFFVLDLSHICMSILYCSCYYGCYYYDESIAIQITAASFKL